MVPSGVDLLVGGTFLVNGVFITKRYIQVCSDPGDIIGGSIGA